MEAKWIRTIRKRSDIGAIGGTIILFIVFSLIAPDSWLTSFTLRNVLHITAILGIVAIGQALMLISHEIDLSVGSVYGVTATAFLSFEPSLGIIGSFLAAMLIAALIGFLNGLLTLKGRVASMIVTLGGLFFYRGVHLRHYRRHVEEPDGRGARACPDSPAWREFSRVRERHTLAYLFGRNFFHSFSQVPGMEIISRLPVATQASALARGVRVERTKWIAFVCCSCLAGFSGIVTVADRPQSHVHSRGGCRTRVDRGSRDRWAVCWPADEGRSSVPY